LKEAAYVLSRMRPLFFISQPVLLHPPDSRLTQLTSSLFRTPHTVSIVQRLHLMTHNDSIVRRLHLMMHTAGIVRYLHLMTHNDSIVRRLHLMMHPPVLYGTYI
jgi:hypothetical protein